MTEPATGIGDQPGATRSVRAAADDLKDEGRKLATETKEAAAQVVKGRKADAEKYLRALATATSSGASVLKDEGHRASASLAAQAAEELERLAGRLSEREVSDLVSGLEDMGRRRPGLFFCAALIAGFGATRLLRSTSPQGREEPQAGREEFAQRSLP